MNTDLAMHLAGKLEGLSSNLLAIGQHDLAGDVAKVSIALRTRIDEDLLAADLCSEAF